MSDIVLLVFEGAKTEPQILDNLKQHYFTENKKTVIRATFDTHIYTLWDIVKDDDFLDLLEVIRERNDKNKKELEGISRDNVSQIFLFFDYDGHVREASDDTIKKMLAHFNDETEQGKLYVSYPMVEALKHLQTGVDFKDTVVSAKSKIKCEITQQNYKQLVNRSTSYQDLTVFTRDIWNFIVVENVKKANFIVNGVWEITPYQAIISELGQSEIFKHQLRKYIEPKEQVAVLSAFPFFIIEYFGEKEYL